MRMRPGIPLSEFGIDPGFQPVAQILLETFSWIDPAAPGDFTLVHASGTNPDRDGFRLAPHPKMPIGCALASRPGWGFLWMAGQTETFRLGDEKDAFGAVSAFVGDVFRKPPSPFTEQTFRPHLVLDARTVELPPPAGTATPRKSVILTAPSGKSFLHFPNGAAKKATTPFWVPAGNAPFDDTFFTFFDPRFDHLSGNACIPTTILDALALHLEKGFP